jgi:prepilin signal peptidase PulO-like enzyme (type II secretory pathway)
MLVALADRLCERPSPRSLLRSPLVITVTTMLSAAAAAAAAWRWDLATAVTALPLLALALPAVLVDLQEQRLPRRLILPFSTTAILVAWLPGAVRGDTGAPARVLIAAAATGIALLAVGLANADLMGWGDVRFGPGLAAYLAAHGWTALLIGVALSWAFLLATVIVRRARPSGAAEHTSPYGPAMLLGTVTALLIA